MKKIAVLLVLVFIASCSHVPREVGYPTTHQEKMQASEHWQVLAKEIAGRVKLAVSEKEAIFIAGEDQSVFDQAIRSFLATELQDRGMMPMLDPGIPCVYALDWRVQRVIHRADRNNDGSLPIAFVDFFRALFVGGMYYGSVPHSEVIVSYDLWKNEREWPSRILRGTQIYYINDVDIGHYIPQLSGLQPIKYRVVDR